MRKAETRLAVSWRLLIVTTLIAWAQRLLPRGTAGRAELAMAQIALATEAREMTR